MSANVPSERPLPVGAGLVLLRQEIAVFSVENRACVKSSAETACCGLALINRLWLRRILTLRRLMSYIYIYIYIYMEHPFLMFLDHTQRRSTVGRTPLDE